MAKPAESAGLESMTGYGESTATLKSGVSLRMTIRSVNGKSLDMRFRLPPGCEAAEPALKGAISAVIKRGNLQVAISADQDETVSGVVIDEAAFEALAKTVQALASRTGMAPPTAGDILALRSVVTSADRLARDASSPAADALEAILPDLSEAALDHLVTMRRNEGAALAALVRRQMQTIRDCVQRARVAYAKAHDDTVTRIGQQVEAVLKAVGNGQMDADRLYAEAALIAVRSDISEELDRLEAHAGAIEQLVDTGGVVGRRLEFLAQELNREANTICSKASSLEVTNIGLELKSVIDQFREQCANIQ